jgi:DME family drug/metabolite transporter
MLGESPVIVRPRMGAVFILVAGTLWATTGTSASFLPANVSPLATGAASFIVGSLLLFLTSFTSSVGVLRTPAHRIRLGISALAVAAFPLSFYSSMHLAGVAVGTVVTVGSAPIFAALLEILVYRRRPRLLWLLASASAVLGVLLLALSGLASGAEGRTVAQLAEAPFGILLGLVAGFSYAYYTFESHRLIICGQPSRGVFGAMFALAASVLIPVLLLVGSPLLQSPLTIGIVGYLALGPMFAAYLFFGAGLRSTSGSTATTLTLIEPFVATILAVAVVGERLAALGWAGLVLILVGVTVTVVGG